MDYLEQIDAMEATIVTGARFDYTAIYQDGQPHRTVTVIEVKNRRVTFEVEGERYMKFRRSLAASLVDSLAERI